MTGRRTRRNPALVHFPRCIAHCTADLPPSPARAGGPREGEGPFQTHLLQLEQVLVHMSFLYICSDPTVERR
jgi:hypothetical protein